MPNTQLRFPPQNDSMGSEIPVYLMFKWGGYTRKNSDRTKEAIGSSGNHILVPYPKLFNVSNDMKYADSGSIAFSVGDLAKLQIDNLTAAYDKLANFFTQGGSAFTFDNMETVLQPGSRRKYVVSMDLIAKNQGQAEMAVKIANTFQLNTHSAWEGGNALIWIHPPLWIVEACDSSGKVIPGWSPSGLPSVLAHVDINKNPVLDTPFNLTNNHPLALNINLTFIELEPAVNHNGTLKNRAETFTNRGYLPDITPFRLNPYG